MPPVALAYVNRGRWVALCPFLCGSADIAEGDTFLCRICDNDGADPVPLVWPSPEDRQAIEAALAVRPTIAQNCNPEETIGNLLVENVEHLLFDRTTGRVAGDVGADQNRAPGLIALERARRELA